LAQLANPEMSAAAKALTERWGLSPAQSEAAAAALNYLLKPQQEVKRRFNWMSLVRPYRSRQRSRSFLLWAVTGAGKTEMIFPLLEAVLSRGGRALVAT